MLYKTKSMKTTLKRIKVSLAVFWLSIISFPSKVVGQLTSQVLSKDLSHMQTKYWVLEGASIEPMSTLINGIKLFQILLIIVVFIVWIVNFVKIRKIDDKTQKENKTKKTIIFIVIALIIILLLWIWIRLIKKYDI